MIRNDAARTVDEVGSERTGRSGDESDLGLDDPAVTRAVEEYRSLLAAGERPNRDEFLARHPAIARELAACLDGLEFIQAAAPSLQEPDAVRGAPGVDASSDSGPGAPVALGDFRIIREIGRGGMGVVYEATQLSLGRRVALKVLPFAAMMDSKQLLRFKNEASAAAQLHHTNIVPVFSLGSERGVHFYAMQFIEGHTLAEVIGELRRTAGLEEQEVIGDRLSVIGEGDEGNHRSPITDYRSPPSTFPLAALSTERSTKPREFFRTVARVGIEAAEALDYAHLVGIIHRDVKPANLMLDTRGNLWITDFGLARVGTDTNLTMTGDLVGTLRYMSPEQALAKRVIVDHRTDIYSLGVTLYELLTLQPAFADEDRHELLRQIAFDEPRSPRRINDRIPHELETIVLKAMAKNPTERYTSAQELADDLERLLRDEPIKARRPSIVQRTRKWARRHQPLVWSTTVCVMIAIVAIAGSIGWFAGDRAARWAAVERQVDLALEEATQLMRQTKWPAARAWLERAEGLLAGGGSRDEVRQRVSSLRNDLDLVQRLEDVRLEKAAVLDGGMTYAEVDARYAQLFRDYGIDIDEMGVDVSAERIRQSAVCSELTAMIDDWMMVRRRARGSDEASWKKVLAVARAADPNELRGRLRVAFERGDRKVLLALADSAKAGTLPSPSVVLLAHALATSGENEQAMSLLHTVSRMYPGDFWINYVLAEHLHDAQPPRFEEMLQFSRVALALRPQSAAAARSFGDALRHNAALDEAITELRDSIRLKPEYAEAHSDLGRALTERGDLDEAIVDLREAIRLKPDLAWAHDNLGIVLFRKGAFEEGIAEHREAIRLKPDLASAHDNLGVALTHRGAWDEAITELREAIRLKPDYAEAHSDLGAVLANKGALDEAITEWRHAIRLKPDYAEAHYNLGAALEKKSAWDEAIAENQEAIRLKPDYPEAHCNLGMTLMRKGQFREALTANRRGHELGSRNPNWPYPSAQWVARAERFVEMDDKLAAVQSGEANPSGAAEQIEFAWLCLYYKHQNATATRFYAEAFTAQPELAADLTKQHRYNAACAAALAGCGQGEDSRSIDDEERERLRQQALDWLRADLESWRNVLESDSADSRAKVVTTLKQWQTDSDLAGVRDADVIAKLPEAEREAWGKLWAEVAVLSKEGSRE